MVKNKKSVYFMNGFFTKSTASMASKMESAIKCNMNTNRRAKTIKKFIIKEETTEEELIKEQDREMKQTNKKNKIALGFDEQCLLMALTKKRTAVRYGNTNFCNMHKTLATRNTSTSVN